MHSFEKIWEECQVLWSSQESIASWDRYAQSSSGAVMGMTSGIENSYICLKLPHPTRQELPTEVCISQRKKLIITMDFSKWITILSMFENASSLWTVPLWMKWKQKWQMGPTWSHRAKCLNKIVIDLLSVFSDRPSSNQSGWEMESISGVVKCPWSLQVTAQCLPFSTTIKSFSQERDGR